MKTVGEVYKESIAEGKEFGILSSEIRILICFNMDFAEQIDVILNKDDEMKNIDAYNEQFKRLKNGEPIEYITNRSKFLGNNLFVDDRVLIPRSETEELVAKITEMIPDYYDPRNYLVCADIGCGSGAITIALHQTFPNWIFLPSDLSEDAIDVAKINFDKHGVSSKIYNGDALEPFIKEKINLDIIVSNPPYILNKEDVQQSVIDYEPGIALWMEKGNSVYDKIFKDYKKVKKGPLFMAFELSPDIKEYLESIMELYLDNYKYEFVDDLNGNTRFLFVYCE